MTHLTLAVSERDHAQGSLDAPVTLVNYGDFGCRYCAQASTVVGRLQREMGGQMRFVFRNFPLVELRPNAMAAACFAEAAGFQGLYWPTHDWLFRRQESLDPAGLERAARSLHLDLDEMRHAHLAARARVQADLLSGQSSGVRGAPTFFINGQMFENLWDYTTLLAALREAACPSSSRTSAPSVAPRQRAPRL